MNKKNANSDIARLNLLEKAFQEAQGEARTLEIFDTDLQSLMQATATSYRTDLEALRQARTQVKLRRDQLRAGEAELKRLLRRAFQVVRARAQEPDFPTAYVARFQLKQDASFTNAMRKMQHPLQIAKDVLSANAELLAAGVTVLIDPSPEQIQAKLDECQAYQHALNDALDVERAALAPVRERRAECDLLIRRISLEIETATLGWSVVARRNLMRSYGFQFTPSKAKSDADADAAQADPSDGRADDEPVDAGAGAGTDQGEGEDQGAGEDQSSAETETAPLATPTLTNLAA